jgi:hypothetical protein
MKYHKMFLLPVAMLSFLFLDCSRNKPSSPVDLNTANSSAWKDTANRIYEFKVYTSGNTSNYVPTAQANNTLYDLVKDSVTFHQKLVYSPMSWDSTFIPDTVFKSQCGTLVSDVWSSQAVDYYVEGLYLYQKGLYIKYQRTAFPIDAMTSYYRAFLFILVNSNIGDSLILVENNTVKKTFYAH